MTTQEPQPVHHALVWWSVTKACWCCQIGNNITHHYSEPAAAEYGKLLAAMVHNDSVVREVA